MLNFKFRRFPLRGKRIRFKGKDMSKSILDPNKTEKRSFSTEIQN